MKLPRSSLLALVPRITVRERAAHFGRRIAILLGGASLIALLAFMVGLRRLPAAGLGYVLYWLHDHIYLWLKGYTFTLAFPHSLIWWGIIFTFFLVWLVSVIGAFLAHWALLRKLYLVWARCAIYQRGLHRPMVLLSRGLRRLGCKPRLLIELLVQERTKALNRLAESPATGGNHRLCRTVQMLNELWIDLFLTPRPDVADRLQASVCWLQAFLHSRLCGDERSVRLLAASIEPIVGPLLAVGSADGANDPVVKDRDPFSPRALAADLLCLATLAAAHDMLEAPKDLYPNVYTYLRLAEMVEVRRRHLNQANLVLERVVRERQPRPDLVTTALVRLSPLSPTADTNLLQPGGQLALGIASALAIQVGTPEIALASVEAAEMLVLTLDCFSDGLAGAGGDLAQRLGAQVAQLSALVAGLPRAEDYWICARLATRQSAAAEQAWNVGFTAESRAIKAGAWAVMGMRTAILEQAAGPGLEAVPRPPEAL